MRRNLILTIALLLAALALGACAPGPTGGGVPGPYCNPATLLPPQLIEPNDGGIFVLYTSHLFWPIPMPPASRKATGLKLTPPATSAGR